MRQHLATLLASSSMLAGCSVFYDTSDLPKIDAPPPPEIDAPDAFVQPDADLSNLSVLGATPSMIYEGQGAHDSQDLPTGSRPAVLVLTGTNLVKDGTTVTLKPAAGEIVNPVIVVDNAAIVVDATHTHLAVPVRIDVDPTIGMSRETIALDIVVTNAAAGGDHPLVGALTLQALPELAGGPVTLADQADPYDYSMIDASIDGTPGATNPLRIHSWSTVRLGATLHANASGATPGPGGGNGGPQVDGGVAGISGGGANGGMGGAKGDSALFGGAGGDGKSATWTGSDTLPTLIATSTPNRSSGGGSGGGGVTLAGIASGKGGAGGGGGGTVHIVADGNLTVTDGISAHGDVGVDVSGNGGIGGNGGGGSVVLQAGGTLDVTGTIDVAGSGSGQTAAPAGRVRYEAAMINGAVVGYRGPAFVDAPLITTVARPTIKVVGKANTDFKYYFSSSGGGTSLFDGHFGTDGNPSIVLSFTPEQDLGLGLNRFCILVPDAARGSDTENCVSIAYLRGQ